MRPLRISCAPLPQGLQERNPLTVSLRILLCLIPKNHCLLFKREDTHKMPRSFMMSSILDTHGFGRGRENGSGVEPEEPLTGESEKCGLSPVDCNQGTVQTRMSVRCPSPMFRKLVTLATPLLPSELFITSERATE